MIIYAAAPTAGVKSLLVAVQVCMLINLCLCETYILYYRRLSCSFILFDLLSSSNILIVHSRRRSSQPSAAKELSRVSDA
eukprot:SAG25_NODE_599_length_6648_cov_22.861964_2_plen_80_part_00